MCWLPKRALELAAEKGAGAWLTSLPLQSMGYTLNKQEFRDAICLRYGWRIPNTPIYCACKAKNSVDHTLNCKLGGDVHMRHNQIRDFEADLLKEVCKDVKVEPLLLPLGNSGTLSTNTAEKARLDVCQRLGYGVPWKERFSTSGSCTLTPPPTWKNLSTSYTFSTKQRKSERTTTGFSMWRKDPSHPLYFQPLVGWVLSPRDTINASRNCSRGRRVRNIAM